MPKTRLHVYIHAHYIHSLKKTEQFSMQSWCLYFIIFLDTVNRWRKKVEVYHSICSNVSKVQRL